MKNYFMNALLFNLATIFLFLNYAMSINIDSINDNCKKAAAIDQNFSYDFCVAFLQADPKAETATLADLELISINLAISNSTNIISHISQLLNQKSLDPYISGALKDCLKLYNDAKSDLQDAISDLKSNDYYKANSDVSAAMDSSTTCEDGFKEKKGVVSPMANDNKSFFQITAIILSFMTLAHK
ncbi:putative invertase inhibitor [Mercurialis annua]|uniref:putative invertase inhibitor n=1 Tax=Mercurialis annua TaxID=3986 RepID=UPI00215EB285|nr:putative invertase inhibitor [Mercurialis annua]